MTRSLKTSSTASMAEPALAVPALQDMSSQQQQNMRRLADWAAVLHGRPHFHLQPVSQGWINDPNGIHWDPRSNLYHMFYQHYRTGSSWQWGLSWGHSVSKDLVNWHHMQPILDPTSRSADADGVWSGCAFPTAKGTVILNTAVKLRASTAALDLPPVERDLGLQMIESQTFATADMHDPLLRTWAKGEEPFLPLPPTDDLSGWRDPFLVGQPGDGLHDKWTIIIGAGYKAPVGAGTALVYTSDEPTSGWEYRGELCRGNGNTGSMWECPLLTKLSYRPPSMATSSTISQSIFRDQTFTAVVPVSNNPTLDTSPRAQHAQHMFVICPDNAHHAPVYYLGSYDPQDVKFQPSTNTCIPLDIGGPTFYAPNLLMNDPHGRKVMWGWVQELGRPAGEYNSACCLSQPRVIWQHPTSLNRIWQEPLPTLDTLRIPELSWSADTAMGITPGKPVELHATKDSRHMEISVTLKRPSHVRRGRACKSGVLFDPCPTSSTVPLGEASGRNGAALLMDWHTQRLEVVYSDGSIPVQRLAGLPAGWYQAMNSASTVTMAQPPPSPGGSLGRDGASPFTSESGAWYDTELHVDAAGQIEGDEEELDIERRAVNIGGCHMVGGKLHPDKSTAGIAGSGVDRHGRMEEVTLRIFLDGSLMEVFTSTGEVLTCRVYRDEDSTDSPPAISLASFGGVTTAASVAVHHMGTIWEPESALQDLEAELLASMHQQRKQADRLHQPVNNVVPTAFKPAKIMDQAGNNGESHTYDVLVRAGLPQ